MLNAIYETDKGGCSQFILTLPKAFAGALKSQRGDSLDLPFGEPNLSIG